MIVHTDADFDTYCQPCDGEYEKDEECTMDVCEESGTAPTDSKDYMHHHCCEQSTAFRVSSIISFTVVLKKCSE